MEKQEIFDTQAAKYELWYQTPAGHYADTMEKELFLRIIKPEPGQSLLDIGCGTGHYLAFFRELGLKVAGIDASRQMLEVASGSLGTNIGLYEGNAEKLPFDDNSFDIVTLITVLEFVPDPLKVLEEAARVARSQIYLGILNKMSLLAVSRRVKGKFRESIYNKARFYSIWEMEAMARRVLGPIPLQWRSVLCVPLSWYRCAHWLDRISLSTTNPFGAFLGIRLGVGEKS